MNSAMALEITEHPAFSEDLYRCGVQSASNLDEHCVQVFLSLPADYPSFHAGQYIELVLADGQSRPYSIANFDPQGRTIELHIERNWSSSTTTAIIDQLQSQHTIGVKPAQGDVALRANPSSPLTPQVFLAAGSGFAQVKALLQHFFHQDQQHAGGSYGKAPVYLLWGTDTPAQRYLKVLVRSWLSRYQNLQYRPLNWQQGDSWEHGLATFIQDCKQAQFYLCGSPSRVYQTSDYLESQGIASSQIQSDVFAYAPRPVQSKSD
ncbi:hypothetical protein DV711_03195 [Motiliproteus coralliicola]|uniref:FAD-binding FR-type domain-containing protein n=1 Tax=Motiliproteus coralliicola TaxID=2283196 RepID=A0A369WR71_9GAMM|nr:hypothetical protein [Motiliproteus coralliicola]RDE24608.1 hypothetical protein DV711_03195 [Motiliproteus coralliicola]